jgi:aromatic-L-amino-acid decarboxylase
MSSEDIERLRGRRAPVDMTPEQFRKAGHKLVDDIAEFVASWRDRPVNYNEQPSQIKALLPGDDLPEPGADPTALLTETAGAMFDHSLLNGHPRFYGYITAGPTPIGMLAEMLAASVNPNVGAWELSPVATEIEKQTVRWIAQLIGFPTGGAGLFVSGGNVANFVCFLAARRAKATWDIRARGLGANGRMLVYASSETHVWIQKALDLFGHGTENIRTIPVRPDLRADVESLHKEIEDDRRRGDHPFLIIGTAGTVATGAVDPLHDLAAVAREYGLWFHVDGAYGALAAALPDAPADLKALSEADSVAVDPHKWLYAPLEAGVALVRDPEALPDAFSYRPPYYHFNSKEEVKTNFYEYGFQNSRGFRALKVWLALRQAGRSGCVQMIADDIALAREIYRRVDATPEMEALTQNLSITTFRFVPKRLAGGDPKHEDYLNELNDRTLTRMWESGESFLSNAVIDGRFVLRACIVNFRTSLEDVEAIPEIVLRHGREVDAAMQESKEGD